MKKLALIAFALVFVISAQAQEKPLTNKEFVSLVYGVQKAPQTKQTLIDALRQRGIGFALTEGLRGFVRSKTANDEEVRRALEQAERRRRDPEASKPPSAAEAATLLESTRKNTLDAVSEMPDFVVKQQIERSAAFAGTNNFRGLDRLVVAVSYRSSGQEEYKVLSVNGAIQNDPKAKQNYAEVGGTSSTGEFVTVLATIFNPVSETKFAVVDSDLVAGRRAVAYDFSVDVARAQQRITAMGTASSSTLTGMKGRLWIDRENARVLRIQSDATDIPPSFPVTSARRTIDYAWATIADEKYLLPLLSDVRLTLREKSSVYETRNLIRFKDYQKYGPDEIVLEEDNTPIPEGEPKP
jgi:hypothetical protein